MMQQMQSPEQYRSSSNTKQQQQTMQQRSMSRNRKRDHTISRSMAQAAAAAAAAVPSPRDQQSISSNVSERRRNMSFMKYSSSSRSSRNRNSSHNGNTDIDQEQRTTSNHMHRTREHAKQLAMALSNTDDPMITASTSFADFHSAFGGGGSNAFDSTTPRVQQQRQQHHQQPSEDLFANFHQEQQQQLYSHKQYKQQQLSLHDTSERSMTESTTHNSSSSHGHRDIDFFQGDPFAQDYNQPKLQQQSSLSTSLQQQQQQIRTSNSSNSRRNAIKQKLVASKMKDSAISIDHNDSNGAGGGSSSSRSDPPLGMINSMSTTEEVDWPSTNYNNNNNTVVRVSALTASPVVRRAPNSTASSSSGGGGGGSIGNQNNRISKVSATKLIHRQQQQNQSVPEIATTPDRSVSSSISQQQQGSISGGSSSIGAAARRLMRQQLRTKSGMIDENNAVVSTSATGYGIKRTDSTSSSKGSNNNATTNNHYYVSKPIDHVAHYSNTIHHGSNKHLQQQMSNSVPQQPGGNYHHHRHSNSSVPSESSDGSSNYNHDVNLFEATTTKSNGNKAGFSFDAFGLDSDVMQREVNEAMNELAGSHPMIVSQLFIQDPKDDFAFGRWDDHQSNSSVNNNSETMSTTGTDEQQQNGFVDGFRITSTSATNLPNMPLHHVRESPTRSEKSSLTSESLEQYHTNTATTANMNMFKQQAGFHTSNKPRKVVRPTIAPQLHTSSGSSSNNTRRSPQAASLQQQVPQMPKLDAHVARTSTKQQLSPRNNLRQPSEVEFYGEESSTDDDNANPSLLQNATIQQQHQQQHYANSEIVTNSDVGIGSDFDLPSDVGVSSEVGGAHSDIGHLPFIDVREKEKKTYPRRSSPSVRTESTSATTTADEKKEEENPAVSTVGNLRSQWEKREKAIKSDTNKKLIERQHVPSALSREHIERLQNQLGDVILSPELLTSTHTEYFEEPKMKRSEDSLQKQRVLECANQRTSLSSVKERLRSTALPRPDDDRRKSKSEGGAAVRHSGVNSILSNLQKNGLVVDSRLESPASDPSRGRPFTPSGQPWSPARSEISPYSKKSGSSAGFESQAMKLLRQQNEIIDAKRRTPTNSGTPNKSNNIGSPSRSMSNAPSSSPKPINREFVSVSNDSDLNTHQVSTPTKAQPQKQLTYRERRELELQQQREEEERRLAQEKVNRPEKKDVSALIRQRIASTKKNSQSVSASALNNDACEQQLDISTLRNKLRPTPIETTNEQPIDRRQPTNHQQSQNTFESNLYPTDASVGSIPDDKSSLYDNKRDLSEHVSPLPHNHVSKESPNRTNDRIPTPKTTELEIEDESMKTSQPTGRVNASAAVSHMLMLQQLQQKQPKKTPLSIDTSEPIAKQAQHRQAVVPGINVENESVHDEQKSKTPKATMMMLNAFLAGRESIIVSDRQGAPPVQGSRSEEEPVERLNEDTTSSSTLCALKDDPKYARYFKMLSIGMPMEVVKHAMTRDGLDASVMDGDHSKPVGIPLKDDPTFSKYFRMLKIGLPMEAVKHAMERDGLDSAVMDQDHDLPVTSGKQSTVEAPKEQDSHRRARLHWKTLRKVTSNSLWAQIDEDNDFNIEIDEEEFQGLFQADKDELGVAVTTATTSQKRGSSVCVIDSKRANNGGIILARLKMSHDDLADAVDRIDERNLTGEQIENIIEYLPSKDERKALESYMLEGGQDAAEKFDGLCECEKFMVSMMTVKHAKRKVSALLFKLQFESCIEDIQKEACAIEQACEELSSSVRLRQLLGIVLTFGNRLNTAGNGKNKAGAFTLDSLLKLNQAKAFDKKTTFLHYIILIVQRNNELLLNFKDDLPTVFTSEKIFWDQCVTDLEEVENQLENVRKMALYQAHQGQSYRMRRKSKKEDPDESLSDVDEALTLEEEVDALRSTPIGLFTLSAIKYVSALRDNVENTKAKFARLLEYFGEEEKQLQPHELFSIIVSFSRDFDKAKEQVLANERLKQREERKRQTTPGRSNTNTPNLSNIKSGGLKASNMQPNMSAILNELKSNGKRITDDDTGPRLQSPPLRPSTVHSGMNVRSNDPYYPKAPPLHQQQSQQYSDDSNHRTSKVDLHQKAMSPIPHPSPQYMTDPHTQSIPITSHVPEPQIVESRPMSRKSPSNGQSKMVHGAASPLSVPSDDNNYHDDNASHVTTETVNSSASTSSIAMRAKARMRKQRSEQRQISPIPIIMSPTEKSTTTSNSGAPSPSESIQPSPRVNNNESSNPLSPRSNIRMKRRADIKNKGRRSSSSNTNQANIQL